MILLLLIIIILITTTILIMIVLITIIIIIIIITVYTMIISIVLKFDNGPSQFEGRITHVVNIFAYSKCGHKVSCSK